MQKFGEDPKFFFHAYRFVFFTSFSCILYRIYIYICKYLYMQHRLPILRKTPLILCKQKKNHAPDNLFPTTYFFSDRTGDKKRDSHKFVSEKNEPDSEEIIDRHRVKFCSQVRKHTDFFCRRCVQYTYLHIVDMGLILLLYTTHTHAHTQLQKDRAIVFNVFSSFFCLSSHPSSYDTHACVQVRPIVFSYATGSHKLYDRSNGERFFLLLFTQTRKKQYNHRIFKR